MFRAPSEGPRHSMTTPCSTATSDGPFVRTRSVSQKWFPALYQEKKKAVQSHGSFGVTRAGFTSLYSSSLSLNKDFTRLTGLKQGATELETTQYSTSSAQCSLNRVRTQTANSLLKLRKIFAEPLRQGIPPSFQPQHFVQPKPGPCGVRAVHHSKRLDERSTAPPSPHAARPRYVLHQHAQTAFSKLPQDRLATACCVCASRVRIARCT